LLNERAQLAVYDPQVTSRAILSQLAIATGLPVSDLEKRVHCESDPYRAADRADALAVLTEWDEFKSLDFEFIYRSMKKPAFAFDGRNILPHALMRAIGYDVQAIGKSFPTGAPTSAQYSEAISA